MGGSHEVRVIFRSFWDIIGLYDTMEFSRWTRRQSKGTLDGTRNGEYGTTAAEPRRKINPALGVFSAHHTTHRSPLGTRPVAQSLSHGLIGATAVISSQHKMSHECYSRCPASWHRRGT